MPGSWWTAELWEALLEWYQGKSLKGRRGGNEATDLALELMRYGHEASGGRCAGDAPALEDGVEVSGQDGDGSNGAAEVSAEDGDSGTGSELEVEVDLEGDVEVEVTSLGRGTCQRLAWWVCQSRRLERGTWRRLLDSVQARPGCLQKGFAAFHILGLSYLQETLLHVPVCLD